MLCAGRAFRNIAGQAIKYTFSDISSAGGIIGHKRVGQGTSTSTTEGGGRKPAARKTGEGINHADKYLQNPFALCAISL